MIDPTKAERAARIRELEKPRRDARIVRAAERWARLTALSRETDRDGAPLGPGGNRAEIVKAERALRKAVAS